MAKIKEVRCIRTRQNGTWVIVKIITDQPGLYGIGSASEHNTPPPSPRPSKRAWDHC